jgi:hypothetical protein
MSFQDVYESAVLGAILNGTPIANLLDNAASSPLTNLHLALHTADPGEAGAAQTTSEAAYPGYARLAVARTPGSPQWTISGAGPTSATCGQKVFAASTGAGTTLTNWSLGIAATGTGAIIFKGALGSSIPIPASPATSPTITPTIQLD